MSLREPILSRPVADSSFHGKEPWGLCKSDCSNQKPVFV